MEDTAGNIDRLVSVRLVPVEMRFGKPGDRSIIAPLYDYAVRKLGGTPISLAAAKSILNRVSADDRVFLISDFAAYPRLPYGETDGPLGVASLARAIRYGLNGFPIILSGERAMQSNRATVKAIGLSVNNYEDAKNINNLASCAAAELVFPCVDEKESQIIASSLLDTYSPKAVISVETSGPNRKGVKHFGWGNNAEVISKMPHLEYVFHEANARGILTIGIIDHGNELGSGSIEEEVRRIVPYADTCRCPCKAGSACNVKTDIVFPVNISNWGCYAITAVLACLLKKPDLLHDAETERRMLEACITAGAFEGQSGRPVMGIDGVGHEANEAVVTMLNAIVKMALSNYVPDYLTPKT